jgi:hypothetical protein
VYTLGCPFAEWELPLRTSDCLLFRPYGMQPSHQAV